MIIVLTFDLYEQGTDPVVDWLLYYNADFIKVTIQDLISKDSPYNIDVNEGKIYHNGIDLIDKINVVWYRRFEDDLKTDIPSSKHSEQAEFELTNEIETLTEYLKFILKDKKWMPYNQGMKWNKLQISYLANKYQIPTPKSLITNNKNGVIEFSNSLSSDLICKPINHSSYFIENDYTYSIYTTKVKQQDIIHLPNRFTTTLFQECINADFEIRVFYLDGDFYATAIIIEDKPEHVVDVKLSYGSNHINWIPYQLPKQFEEKLHLFMQEINLNTGSLDIIKLKDGSYTMLEINPVGQYSAPGYRCNYYLEEKIAKWLIKHDEK